MDFLEQAFEEEQNRLDKNIRQVGSKNTGKQEPTGYCLNCFEDVAADHLFCDGKCADAYHAKQKFAVTC